MKGKTISISRYKIEITITHRFPVIVGAALTFSLLMAFKGRVMIRPPYSSDYFYTIRHLPTILIFSLFAVVLENTEIDPHINRDSYGIVTLSYDTLIFTSTFFMNAPIVVRILCYAFAFTMVYMIENKENLIGAILSLLYSVILFVPLYLFAADFGLFYAIVWSYVMKNLTFKREAIK